MSTSGLIVAFKTQHMLVVGLIFLPSLSTHPYLKDGAAEELSFFPPKIEYQYLKIWFVFLQLKGVDKDCARTGLDYSHLNLITSVEGDPRPVRFGQCEQYMSH